MLMPMLAHHSSCQRVVILFCNAGTYIPFTSVSCSGIMSSLLDTARWGRGPLEVPTLPQLRGKDHTQASQGPCP